MDLFDRQILAVLRDGKSKKFQQILQEVNVQSSTLVPNGTAYAIDARVAGIMLIRRDVTIKDWSDPVAGQYDIRATTRFGLGIYEVMQ